MIPFDSRLCLPSAEELPDSDDTPVDNELQDLVPSLLKAVLALLWSERQDWFFGIDMGVYYHPEQPPLVPDGFLSLGVMRVIDESLRPSYVLWEENNIPPIFVLEVVSKTHRGEYSTKLQKYAQLGSLYYAIYNPLRRRYAPLEVYKLVSGSYLRQQEETIWMEEIGLGIGRRRGFYLGIEREWLYWFDREGRPYPTPEERISAERERADREYLRAERLAELLRRQGIDPEA